MRALSFPWLRSDLCQWGRQGRKEAEEEEEEAEEEEEEDGSVIGYRPVAARDAGPPSDDRCIAANPVSH